jgi:hypothetical protein
MMRIVLFLGLMVLGGCAHKEPVSCDGSDKRPINPGKWDQSMSLSACGSKQVRP